MSDRNASRKDSAQGSGPASGGARAENPERSFRRADLVRGDGIGGRPAYVAHAGIVYDVSGCPKWRTGLHEGQHFPGQDLTEELPQAPHTADVFLRPCVKRVGILVEEM